MRERSGVRALALRVPVLAAALLVAVLTQAGPEAEAQSLSDLREEKERIEAERDELQEQQAVLASELDAEQAELDDIIDALDAIQADLDAKEERLASANEALGRAEDQVDLAILAEDRTRIEAEQLEGELQNLAVEAYVNPAGDEVVEALISGDVLEAPQRRVLLDVTAQVQVDLIDRYREVRAELSDRADVAADAVALTEQRREAADREVAAVEEAKARQEDFAADVEARIEHLAGEAASLEAIDDTLAAELRSTNSEITERVRQIEEAARRRAPSSVGAPAPPSEIVSVQGIWVHQSIADNVDALLTAAAADGISLGGGGYRSAEGQLAVRRRNCGTSDYAIYEMPASSCRPPTARPGSSMHERGLAIDFTYNGRGIGTRSNAAYQWLAENASRFGLYNLPSEPWHWSTNGR
ncbi:MAG: D-alanyl-D-alanine carboxypeptidase family protein [Actinomycetota bacterium]